MENAHGCETEWVGAICSVAGMTRIPGLRVPLWEDDQSERAKTSADVYDWSCCSLRGKWDRDLCIHCFDGDWSTHTHSASDFLDECTDDTKDIQDMQKA